MASFEKMRSEYGAFLAEGKGIDFDPNDVPESLRGLIAYAKFWGVPDDGEREQLAQKAPAQVKDSLKRLIAEHDDALDEWLAGKEAANPAPSKAYIAFSSMRMAADYM